MNWPQNQFQASTTSGYVGGVFSYVGPELTSAGNPTTQAEKPNGVTDLCSDSEDERRASTSATPSNVPTPTTQHSSMTPSGTFEGHEQGQRWNFADPRLTDPNFHYSYGQPQYPIPTTGSYTAGSAEHERASPNPGNHGSHPQPAPPNIFAGDRRPTPPSYGRNLRAEYVNLMQKAKYRFQVAAAGVNGPPVPNTTTPSVPSQRIYHSPGYPSSPQQPQNAQASHPPATQRYPTPVSSAACEKNDAQSQTSTLPPSRSQQPVKGSELSPISQWLSRNSSQNTVGLTSHDANPGSHADRESPAQTATDSASGNNKLGAVATQSASNIDRAFNAAVSSMSSPHSQRATPAAHTQASTGDGSHQRNGHRVSASATAKDTTQPSTTTAIMTHPGRGTPTIDSTPVATSHPASRIPSRDGAGSAMWARAYLGRTASPPSTQSPPTVQASTNSNTAGEAVNSIPAGSPKSTHYDASSAIVPFDYFPQELKTLILSWQRAYKRTDMAFAVAASMIPLVNRSKDGLPAIYKSSVGDVLQVNVYALPRSWYLSEYARYAIVATYPAGHSFIIGRHKGMSKVRVVDGLGIPYSKWSGTFYPNQDGWENEPSVFKTWDGRQVMAPRPGFRVGRPSLSTSTDVQIRQHQQDTTSQDQRSPRRSQRPTPPLDDSLCFCSLPSSLKLLIEQWQVLHGSGRVLPCTILAGNASWVFENSVNRTFSYYHRNGDTLTAWVCKISPALSGGESRRAVVVVSGNNTPPCIISTKKHTGPFEGARPPTYAGGYLVWEGLKGRGENGFEIEPSVSKVSDDKAPSRRSGSKDIIPPLPEQVEGGDTTETDTSDNELSRLVDSEQPNSISSKTPASLSERPDALPETHVMPKPCRDAINEWFRRHPSQPLRSLPCMTGSSRSTLFETTGTNQKTEWYDVNGHMLSVEMYRLFDNNGNYMSFHPLNAPRPGKWVSKDQSSKKVIVAQGFGMSPTIVSLRGRHVYIDGKTPVQRWIGVAGDNEGFEQGAPEIFKCKAKEYKASLQRSGQLVNTDGTDHQTQPSRQITTLPYSSAPTAKRQRTEISRSDQDDTVDMTSMTTRSHSKPTPIPASTSSSKLQIASTSIPLSHLKPHLQTHLVCLFYSHSSSHPAPRARLFAVCDTVEKLFAQALAGSVFADDQSPKGKSSGKSSAKVLSVTLGGKKKIAVAEEDTEDFESVLEAVAGMGWWGLGEEGEVVGSGCLEVRVFV